MITLDLKFNRCHNFEITCSFFPEVIAFLTDFENNYE